MEIVIKGSEFSYQIYFPESASVLPTYTIKLPSGVTFLTGTGEAMATADWYEKKITIPVTAPSSTADSQYIVTWSWTTVYKSIYFDVVDTDISSDEIYQKELLKFAVSGYDYSARLIIAESPSTFTLDLYSNDSILSADIVVTDASHRLGTQLTATVLSALLSSGTFILIWKTDIQDYFQTLNVLSIKYLPIIQKVKFIVDRVVKAAGEPQAILEADVTASIFGGIDYINGVFPVTEWTVTSFPTLINPFLVMASTWWLLNSQYMLESDLAFAYSGQSVSLDYDRTGPISDEISRLQDYMTEHLSKAKKAVLRSPQGVVGITDSGFRNRGLVSRGGRQIFRRIG